MSQEHIERLREGYALINRKDFDAALALVHPDFVWENDPAGPLGATVDYGRAAVKGFWEDFLGSFDDFHQEPFEFREAAGGKILVRARLSTYLEDRGTPPLRHHTPVDDSRRRGCAHADVLRPRRGTRSGGATRVRRAATRGG